MKNSLFFSLTIVVMTLTLLVGCQRNQTVKNTSENEFFKDSYMILIYADDTVEYQYQLMVDSLSGIKMLDSVQRVFVSDMKKHGSIFRCAYLTADIIENCKGKSFEVCDSVNHKLYRFQFEESTGWFNSSEISFESAKGYFRNRNAGSEFLESSGPYLDWK